MTAMRRRNLFLLPRIGLALLSTILTVALVEFGLRTFAPFHLTGIQEAYQYDVDLGYRLRPGIRLFKMTDHLEEIKTNSLGTVTAVSVTSYSSYRGRTIPQIRMTGSGPRRGKRDCHLPIGAPRWIPCEWKCLPCQWRTIIREGIIGRGLCGSSPRPMPGR